MPKVGLPNFFRPTAFSTSAELQSRPGKLMKKGLHKVDRAASKAALKGIDAGGMLQPYTVF